MPRFRVDPSTSEMAIMAEVARLRAEGWVIDALPECRNYWSDERDLRDARRNAIHDEIERLTNIVIVRRRHAPVVA